MTPGFTSTPFLCSTFGMMIVVNSILCGVSARTPVSLSASSGVAQSNTSFERRAVIGRSATRAAIAIDAIRYLDEKNWWELLEIEVKNVSNKPVYFLEVDLAFPDVLNTQIDDVPRGLVVPLTYGRRELMLKGNRASAEDVPIRPGETYILKIPSKYREIQERLAAVKRVLIRVYDLSFGDETGFKAGGVAFSFTKVEFDDSEGSWQGARA
jgi:hypothetical protein